MTNDKRFYVYTHTFSDGQIYVGKGTGNRYKQFNIKRRGQIWRDAFAKNGEPSCKIIASGLNNNEALLIELETYKNLYMSGYSLCNCIIGGKACDNYAISGETRKKLLLRENGMKGKKHNEKTKNLIGLKNKGRFIGHKSPRYDSRLYNFIKIETGESFSGTASQFCIYSKIKRPMISLLKNGKIKSAKGWILKGTDEYGKKGKRHGRYDHTIYNFTHVSGIVENCTRFDLQQKYNLTNGSGNLSSLVKGSIKSYKGWTIRLQNSQ